MFRLFISFLFISISVMNFASDLFNDLTDDITIIVDQVGTGDFTKVQDAIDAVPDNSSQRTVIFIKNGIYFEKIYVPSTKKNLTIIGEHVDSTILSYDDYAKRLDEHGVELGTFRTQTFQVDANNFWAMNITFENIAGDVGQALALFTSGDYQVFLHCKLLGWQDTYYSDSWKRAYFKDCFIAGAVDYIFGRTTVLYDSCQIHTLRTGGYITAASTEENYKFGYVFKDCRLTAPVDITNVYLGRPWKPFAQTVFYNCYEGQCIHPNGWKDWGGRETTCFYAEYNCYGPGSDTTRRDWSSQLTDEQASNYTIENIFASSNYPSQIPDDWLPLVDEDSLYSIVKKHTTKYLDPINVNSKLASLTIDGTPLSGFHPDSTLIVVELPSGSTDIPVLNAIADNELSSVEIIYPDNIPDFATINVVARYEASYTSYSIYFSIDSSFYNADADSIVINKVPIQDFDPDVSEYDILVPEGTSKYMPVSVYPKVTGVKSNIDRLDAIPGQIIIDMTAVDGIHKKTYIINVNYGTSARGLNESNIEYFIVNPLQDILYTKINLKVKSNLEMNLYNPPGVLVRSSSIDNIIPGNFTFEMNTQNLSKGLYFYNLKVNKQYLTGILQKR